VAKKYKADEINSIQFMNNSDNQLLGYSKATSLCATREYCQFDIKEKLFSWGIDIETSEKIIAQLIEEKFIDENRYASFYARDKFKFNGWGKIKIIWNLRLKKIPETIIQEAISTIDSDEYENKLFDLLKEKSRKINNPESEKNRAALLRFAQSRGFDTYEALRVIRKLK